MNFRIIALEKYFVFALLNSRKCKNAIFKLDLVRWLSFNGRYKTIFLDDNTILLPWHFCRNVTRGSLVLRITHSSIFFVTWCIRRLDNRPSFRFSFDNLVRNAKKKKSLKMLFKAIKWTPFFNKVKIIIIQSSGLITWIILLIYGLLSWEGPPRIYSSRNTDVFDIDGPSWYQLFRRLQGKTFVKSAIKMSSFTRSDIWPCPFFSACQE